MSSQPSPQTISTYMEMTPNPATMKFVVNHLLIEDGKAKEFLAQKDAIGVSSLVEKLFGFPFVDSIFVVSNYLAITKKDFIDWESIQLELRDFIRDHLNRSPETIKLEEEADVVLKKEELLSPKDSSSRSPLEAKIIAILDEYVRPAVEQDGGAIDFDSFDEGKVRVLLKGACSGCPSSTQTLKGGIEGLLKRMIPEVQEVEAVEA